MAVKTATATRTATKEETPTNNTAKIHSAVQDAGGVVKVTLGQVRDELGHARLGKMVLKEMAAHLNDSGLGFFPGWVLTEENPEPRQWQEFWVYERDGSPRAAVLDAVSDPDVFDLVGALNMFNDSAPDYAAMDDSARLALIRHIVGA